MPRERGKYAVLLSVHNLDIPRIYSKTSKVKLQTRITERREVETNEPFNCV